MAGLVVTALGLVTLIMQGCGPSSDTTTTTTTLPPCHPGTEQDECWKECTSNKTCTADECLKLGHIGCDGAPCAPAGQNGSCISNVTTTTTTTTQGPSSPEDCFQRCSKVRGAGCCKIKGTHCLWSGDAKVDGSSSESKHVGSANCYVTGVCDGWNWGKDCDSKVEPVPAPAPVPHPPPPTPPSPTLWKLAWSDNFDNCPDDRPDPKNWGFEHGYVRNHEAQWYQKENAACENGHLVITAKREHPAENKSAAYTSSSLTSQHKQEFKYGRYEMHAKIPVDKGAWPAFWLRGAATSDVPWPSDGEIDVCEYYKDTVLANFVHGDKDNKPVWNSARFAVTQEWADQFHVWAMEWEKEEIRLIVDGQVVNKLKISDADVPGQTNPWREFKVYMILNLAIGGDNGGNPSHTDFPVRYQVDYVSFYEPVPRSFLVVE